MIAFGACGSLCGGYFAQEDLELFGSAKRKYRNEALEVMFMCVPAITRRDLSEFGLLQKFQFDALYASGATSREAAFTMGSLYFLELVSRAEKNDAEYFKYMGRYSGWLGACADYIANETGFLTAENREEVARALEKAGSIYLPTNDEATLGKIIQNYKTMASIARSALK